jgi:hypothetical protein
MGKKRQRLKPGKRDGDGMVISVLLLLQATHSGLNPGELPTQWALLRGPLGAFKSTVQNSDAGDLYNATVSYVSFSRAVS